MLMRHRSNGVMRFEFDDAPAAKGIRAQRNIAGVAAPGYMEGMERRVASRLTPVVPLSRCPFVTL